MTDTHGLILHGVKAACTASSKAGVYHADWYGLFFDPSNCDVWVTLIGKVKARYNQDMVCIVRHPYTMQDIYDAVYYRQTCPDNADIESNIYCRAYPNRSPYIESVLLDNYSYFSHDGYAVSYVNGSFVSWYFVREDDSCVRYHSEAYFRPDYKFVDGDCIMLTPLSQGARPRVVAISDLNLDHPNRFKLHHDYFVWLDWVSSLGSSNY